MASATAVAPPATDPEYRKQLDDAKPRGTASGTAALERADSAGTAAAQAAGPPLPTSGSSRRLCVILHGKRADQPDVRQAVQALRSEGVHVDVKVTWEGGDVERFVKDIVRARSTDTIVAAGGDGTLNEVVAALIKVKAPRSIAVGLLPMGTSNDFAAVIGLPQDLEGALRLCARNDNLKPLDVGLLNGEVFMNTATLGASSELGAETSHEAKQLLGPAAYLVKGVARIIGYAATRVTLRFPAPTTSSSQHAPNITPVPSTSNLSTLSSALPSAPAPEPAGPGAAAGTAGTTGKAAAVQTAPASAAPAEGEHQEHVRQLSRGAGVGAAGEVKKVAKKSKRPEVMELTAPILNLTAGNSRQLASMVQACPDALLDDGLLDITYVTGGAAEGATSLVGAILSQGLDAAEPDNVHLMRVPWVEAEVVEADPNVVWPGNRDGEPVPSGRRFLLEALPRRVQMHLPAAASHLLAESADPNTNAPIIAINRVRKGVLKKMLAQVTRFRRAIPGAPSWYRKALTTALTRGLPLAAAAAAGYALGRRSGGGGGGKGAVEKAKEAAGGGNGGRGRRGMPYWPGGRKRTAVGTVA